MIRTARKILLARIGWMTFYGCLDDDHDRLVGGGSWNDHNQGSELHNFKAIRAHLYGFVRAGKSGILALNRIDDSIADEDDELGGVTVIFVATDRNAPHQTERQRIVGWYKNATVHRDCKAAPTGRRRHSHYNLIANEKDAVLLPSRLRLQSILRAKPGAMGQSNVWYPLDENGEPRDSPWLAEALAYMDSYNGDNLIENPETELSQAAQTELEKAAGFESNQRIRNAVEEYAMKVVRRCYKELRHDVEDKHKTQPYDFECTEDGRLRYIEVKGTRTSGNQVLLTPNEVKLPDRKGAIVDLCVVHSVKVAGGKKIKCSGGKLVRYKNWHPRDHDLRTVSFICQLTQSNS